MSSFESGLPEQEHIDQCFHLKSALDVVLTKGAHIGADYRYGEYIAREPLVPDSVYEDHTRQSSNQRDWPYTYLRRFDHTDKTRSRYTISDTYPMLPPGNQTLDTVVEYKDNRFYLQTASDDTDSGERWVLLPQDQLDDLLTRFSPNRFEPRPSRYHHVTQQALGAFATAKGKLTPWK